MKIGKNDTNSKRHHCASSKKEVTDFTKMSHRELERILKKGSVGFGRFSEKQLNTPITVQRNTPNLAPYAASLLIPMTLLGSLKLAANTSLKENTYTSIEVGRYSSPLQKNTITLSGQLIDGIVKSLPNVAITANTSNTSTTSNHEGFYSITVLEGERLTFKKKGFISYSCYASVSLINMQIMLEGFAFNNSKLNKLKSNSSVEILEEKAPTDIEHVTEDKEVNENLSPFVVSGIITDDAGLPFPGVNIIIKGTTIGTQSDFYRLYRIEINKGDTLVYSYVGFEPVE